MRNIEASCSLITNDEKIIGLCLVGPKQAHAWMYCNIMANRLIDGSGHIKFVEDKIVFVNPDKEYSGEVSFYIDTNDSEALEEILTAPDGTDIYSDGFGFGFIIIRKGMKETCERIDLKQI